METRPETNNENQGRSGKERRKEIIEDTSISLFKPVFDFAKNVIAEPKELIRIIKNLKREKKKLIGGL